MSEANHRRAFSVAVYARRGERVLVIEHRRLRTWLPIGGEIEAGETPLEAARRELREETGLVAEVRELERYAYDLADEPSDVRARFAPEVETVQLHTFLAEAPPGWEPVLDEEHDAYRWCSADEAVALLAYPEPREAVRAAEELG